MTPAIRKWLLDKAREELAAAEEEERYAEREYKRVAGDFFRDEPRPKSWQRIVERAAVECSLAAETVVELRAVVADLSAPLPEEQASAVVRDVVDVAWDRGRL